MKKITKEIVSVIFMCRPGVQGAIQEGPEQIPELKNMLKTKAFSKLSIMIRKFVFWFPIMIF